MPDYTSFQGVNQEIIPSEGDHTHLANTNEQDVIEILDNINKIEITLDMTLLLQDTTVRFYEQVNIADGYVLVSAATFSQTPIDSDFTGNAIVFVLNGKKLDQKITFDSAVAEAGSINVPFARVDVVRLEQ